MTETNRKRKNDDLSITKKTIKRMCLKPSENSTDSSCEGQSNEERICDIFQKEIDAEIASKLKDLEVIQERLTECHKDLELLRKAVVSAYYDPTYKKSTKLDQHRIHPAVQKLIGKRPINSSSIDGGIFKYGTRPLTRHMKKGENVQQDNHNNDKIEENTTNRVESVNIEDKIPQYIPPNLSTKGETRLPRGNRQKKQMRILVGNVSKRVTDGSHDKATHKWMLYVRSMGSLDIAEDVSKVRFFLHPSYKPHDVVTIPKAPFTLTRRGWGEFPVRVQLHFHNPLNKTVDILHHLKLDGVSSGPHSRSAETLADIWVYCNDTGGNIKPSSNYETSENLDDLTDSGFNQRCSSSQSVSSEVSDSNMARSCDKSVAKEVFNNTSDASEYSNFSEDSVGFNSSVHSEKSFVSICDDRKRYPVDNAPKGTVYFEKHNNTIGYQNTKREAFHKRNRTFCNSDISFDNSFDENYLNARLQINDEIYKPSNSISPLSTDVSIDCKSKADVKLHDDSSKQNRSLTSDKESLTFEKKHLSDDRLLKDFEVDDVFNMDKISPLNFDLFNGYFNGDDPLSFSKNDSTAVTEEFSDFDKKGNISNFNDLFKVQADLKPKTPDKNPKDSNSCCDTVPTVKTILINDESKCCDSNTECILGCSESVKLKTKLPLLKNNMDFSDNFAVEDDVFVISNFVQSLESQTSTGNELTYINNPSNVVNKFSKSDNLEEVVEGQIKPESSAVKTVPICNTQIKEEIIEIEDCYNNWIDEVVIDADCDVVENFSKGIDPLQGTDGKSSCENTVMKTEPLSSDHSGLTNEEKENCLKNEHQYLSASAGSDLGLTCSIEDFLESAVESGIDSSKDRLSFSSSVLENFDLENIDAKLSAITEIVPKSETISSSKISVAENKNVLGDQLNDAILGLPSLDGFQDYLSNRLRTSKSSPKLSDNSLQATSSFIDDNLIVPQLDTSTRELQIENMFINTDLTTVQPPNTASLHSNNSTVSKRILLDTGKIATITSPTVTTVTKSPQTIEVPKISKPVTVVARQTANSTVLTTKPVNVAYPIVMTAKPVNVNLIKSGLNTSTAPKFLKINSAGTVETFTLATNSPVHTSTTVATSLKGSKQVKLVFRKNDIVSSTPNGLQKSSIILKTGQPVILQSSNKVGLVQKNNCVSVSNRPPNNLSKDVISQSQRVYIPSVRAPGNITVNSNKQGSIIRAVPGVSLLKKNLVTNGTSATTNSIKMPSINLNTQLQRFKVYSVPKSQSLLTNSFVEKQPLQSSKIIEEEAISSSINLLQRTTSDPVLLKNISTASLPSIKEKKIMVLNRMESKKINFDGRITLLQNSLERLATDCKFTDLELAVRWLIRGLPLITPEATQWIYKVIHPYSAPSLAVFSSWPKPKQFASEWLRAKTVCRILQRVSKEPLWTTKQVLYWARYHGYSPATNLFPGVENKSNILHVNQSIEQRNLFTTPENIIKWMENCSEEKNMEKMEVIDVVGHIDTVPEKRTIREELEDENGTVLCGTEWEKNVGGFVRKTVNDLGYRLAREELVPGELHQGAALTVLSHAMMNFAEDLLRRSLAVSCQRETSSIELNDVYSALFNRKEFDIFTNEGLGTFQFKNNQ